MVAKTQRQRFEEAAASLVVQSGVTIRKTRKGMNGSAYVRDDEWAIEAPEPRGPISFGVFAHEVGHQLLHRDSSRPRWVEEVEAEEFALGCFDGFDLPGRDRYEKHAARHIGYAFVKAIRRGGPGLSRLILDTYPRWWDLAEQDRVDAILGPSMSRDRRALDA